MKKYTQTVLIVVVIAVALVGLMTYMNTEGFQNRISNDKKRPAPSASRGETMNKVAPSTSRGEMKNIKPPSAKKPIRK